MPQYSNYQAVYEFNLGLAYISAALKRAGFDVTCLNGCHDDRSMAEQLAEVITKEDIKVVCTGGMSYHYDEIKTVVDEAKNIRPDIITIAGGAIITSDPQMAMDAMPIDYGVTKEGEETIVELAEALTHQKDITTIKGVVYRNNNNNVATTPPRDPITSLDTIAFPDYEGFGYSKHIKTISPNSRLLYYTVLDEVRLVRIVSSRSCPYGCTFCYHPLGKTYRQRSLDNVFAEIDYLVEHYNANLLELMDELFSYDKQRMYEFAERIKPYKLKWMPHLRVTDVDLPLLKALKESGAYLISYGIENMSDTILSSMKKKTTRKQIVKALAVTRQAKLAIQGNILFGDPAETEETITESLDWWKANKKYGVNLTMIRLLPNAPLYQQALKRGLIKDKLQFMKDRFPYINMTKLSDNRYEELCELVASYESRDQDVVVAKVLKSAQEQPQEDGIKRFSTTSVCPECLETSTYRNLRLMNLDKHFLVICRGCHTRLRLKTSQVFYNPLTYNMIKMTWFCIHNIWPIGWLYFKVWKKWKLRSKCLTTKCEV